MGDIIKNLLVNMYVKVMSSKGQSQKIDDILTKHFVPTIW